MAAGRGTAAEDAGAVLGNEQGEGHRAGGGQPLPPGGSGRIDVQVQPADRYAQVAATAASLKTGAYAAGSAVTGVLAAAAGILSTLLAAAAVQVAATAPLILRPPRRRRHVQPPGLLPRPAEHGSGRSHRHR